MSNALKTPSALKKKRNWVSKFERSFC